MNLGIQSSKPVVCMLSFDHNSCSENINGINIVNANYKKVVFVLKQFLRQERFKKSCQCPRCIGDMTALALNYLPPHYYYVDAERGDIEECGSPSVMVESAVLEAIETVTENPRHSK